MAELWIAPEVIEDYARRLVEANHPIHWDTLNDVTQEAFRRQAEHIARAGFVVAEAAA
jgi:hypothetical protein